MLSAPLSFFVQFKKRRNTCRIISVTYFLNTLWMLPVFYKMKTISKINYIINNNFKKSFLPERIFNLIFYKFAHRRFSNLFSVRQEMQKILIGNLILFSAFYNNSGF